jgi:ABC-2 type transport system permease protein
MTIIKTNIISQMSYTLNFFLGCLSDIFSFTAQIAVFITIYSNVDTINGWTLYQVILFMGVFSLIDSIAMITFFLGIIDLPGLVQQGGLDLILTRPLNPLFNVSTRRFNISFIFNVLYSLILVIYAICNLNTSISIKNAIGFLISLIFMYILYFSLMLIFHCLSFWFAKISSVINLHSQFMTFAFKIPGVAYKGIWKIIFMGVLPYGFIATIPVEILTLNMPLKNIFYVFAICLLFAILALSFWKCGLKKYDSASS